MKDRPATSTKPTRSREDWKRYLDRVIDTAAKTRHHGTIRVVFYDGEIRQVIVERSVLDPLTELARSDGAPV